MIKDKNKLTNKILVNTDFFDFLKEKVGERKTRTGAYYDLLEKTSAGFVTPFLKKHEYVLQPNQCHVTISDLAADWHWHRATVRSFLEKLEEMGHISRTQFAKSVVITMSIVQTDNETCSSPKNVQPVNDVADELDTALAKWVSDGMSVTDIEEVCGQYYEQRIKELATSRDENPSKISISRTDEEKEKVINEIAGRIAVAAMQREIRKSRFDSPSAFIEFFSNELLSDWGELLEASRITAGLILDDENSGKKIRSDFENALLPLCKPFKALLAECLERKRNQL